MRKHHYEAALTETFTLIDGGGREHRAHQYTEMVPAGTFADPKATEPGLRFYELEDGRDLAMNPDGSFTVVDSGEVLTWPEGR